MDCLRAKRPFEARNLIKRLENWIDYTEAEMRYLKKEIKLIKKELR